MMYLMVAGGLIALLIGGDVLVRGAVSLAEKFQVPHLIIGLTIVAFGTSAPELVVSATAALEGSAGLAVGNVVGSNIANILMVLGIPAIVTLIPNDDPHMKASMIKVLLASGLFWLFILDGNIAFYEALIFLIGLAAFLGWNFWKAKHGDGESDFEDDIPDTHWGLPLSLAAIIGGIAGLVIGADILVEGATQIARQFGVSEAVIGLTIVAIGTSLPELATSVAAARRGSMEVAVGNVLGSNLFNILAILGVTGMIVDIPVDAQIGSFDIYVMAGAALWLAFYIWRAMPIGKIGGTAMALAYLAYLWAQLP